MLATVIRRLPRQEDTVYRPLPGQGETRITSSGRL